MDRPIERKELKRKKFYMLLQYIIIALVIFSAIWFFNNLLRTKASKTDFYIVKVERGNIKNTLSARGTIIPSLEREINAPVTTEIKNVIKTSGEYVKKGDLILELDQELTKLEYNQLFDELELKRNNIDRLKLEYDKNLRDLDYQNQIKQLQVRELAAQLTDQKRLFKVGGATAEEVEQAELQLKVSELEQKMLENELNYKKNVNVKEKKGLELEYTIQENRLAELSKKLNETKVRAPQNGVITWINDDLGKKVTEGETLARIANLNKYEVEAYSSDRNTDKIQVGMPVLVRVNRQELTGIISSILPAVENNTLAFRIELDDPGADILRPNIRTEVFIITDQKEDILRINNGPAITGAKTQYIYVVQGDKAVKTRITKGLVNSDYIEVLSGLTEGQKVIISSMEDFDHLEDFQLVEKN